jgi:hypothetical protein
MDLPRLSRCNMKPLLCFAFGPLLLSALLNQPATAALQDGLTGYYTFETETAGTVPNAARNLSAPGFEMDGLKLFGGEAAVAGVPLSNLTSAVRAGTGALACDGDGDYADVTVSPVTADTDFSVSVWFKPQTGGTGLTGATRALYLNRSRPIHSPSACARAVQGRRISSYSSISRPDPIPIRTQRFSMRKWIPGITWC